MCNLCSAHFLASTPGEPFAQLDLWDAQGFGDVGRDNDIEISEPHLPGQRQPLIKDEILPVEKVDLSPEFSREHLL